MPPTPQPPKPKHRIPERSSGLSLDDYVGLILLCVIGLVLVRIVFILSVVAGTCAESWGGFGAVRMGASGMVSVWAMLFWVCVLCLAYMLCTLVLPERRSRGRASLVIRTVCTAGFALLSYGLWLITPPEVSPPVQTVQLDADGLDGVLPSQGFPVGALFTQDPDGLWSYPRSACYVPAARTVVVSHSGLGPAAPGRSLLLSARRGAYYTALQDSQNRYRVADEDVAAVEAAIAATRDAGFTAR